MKSNLSAFELFEEVLFSNSISNISNILCVNQGTVRRWYEKKLVSDYYIEDLNRILGYKYNIKRNYKEKDQYYTTKKVSKYFFDKLQRVLIDIGINEKKYTYIEPSAGCCNFYELLPENRRLGIDIEPKGYLSKEILKSNYLEFKTDTKNNIVIGNPPFGLRGNLALRFINHSYNFADVVALILPPLFDSTGKGVPAKRVQGYKLAYSKKLPLDSYQYPSGEKVSIATIFQVWVKINTDRIKLEKKKTCKTIARVYSLSNGGTPSSTRNKNMLDKCDVYLPSTCFSGMKSYDNFLKLPNKRGYGILFLKNKEDLKNIFFKTNWNKICFLSTNSAKNLRTDLIENVITKNGYYDERIRKYS